MKKIILWILGAVLLAGVIAGASLIYDKYSQENYDGPISLGGKGDRTTDKDESEITTEENESGGNMTEDSDADSSESESEEESEESYIAPDFTVVDAQGRDAKLSDFKGRPIVVNFWTERCGYCVYEMPDFQKAYEKYGEDVVFLMVGCPTLMGGTVESDKAFIAENNYTFPIYFDNYNQASYFYGINSLPRTLFIDREFEIYAYFGGMLGYDTVEEYILKILE